MAGFLVPCAFAEQSDYALDTFQSDFGGIGLLQTPTARTAPVGELSFNLAHIQPYTNYTFSVQPLDWFEFGLRYTQIGNRDYAASGDRDLDLLDKGFSLKLSLLDESRYLPDVAVGFRDIGGTGLFGSEYVVANKRWYDFDFSLGLGWGYLGGSGQISNPLTVFGSRFRRRSGRQTGSQGGDFNFNQLFTGQPSFFGGIQYQTPFDPLTLQLEYEGKDYQNEPQGNRFDQDSPVNIGARYKVNDNIVLSAAWERGNTLMLSGTLQLNLAKITQVKNDPVPVPVKPAPEQSTSDWDTVVDALKSNAGIQVSRISRHGGSLYVRGHSGRFRDVPRAELRANRILNNVTDKNVTTIHYRLTNGGMTLRQDSLPRAPLPDDPLIMSPSSGFSDLDYRHDVVSRGTSDRDERTFDATTLYESLGDRFSWSLTPDLAQNFGGPDGYLYKILARADATFRTDENGWFSATAAYSVYDNLDNFDTFGSSQLPRVRTFIGQYLQQTDLGIYNLQYTRTARLSDNWFGMAYAGLLEQMFGGAGAEVLYRPFNSPLAFGIDANWVKQRAFDTQFEFRDYSTVTGHATLYYDTGFKNILAKVSVGRYLAKDLGTTIDVSRKFKSGVRLGAFATFTDAGSKFGEGSFDKGIYLSIPLDLFFTESSRRRASVVYRPITRDGGAQLARRFNLYGLTQGRSLDDYWDDFDGGAQD